MEEDKKEDDEMEKFLPKWYLEVKKIIKREK